MQVCICYYPILAHSAFAFGRFFCEDVTFKSFLESDLTGAGNFKALFCAAVGFNLWHYNNCYSYSLLAVQTDGHLLSRVGNDEKK